MHKINSTPNECARSEYVRVKYVKVSSHSGRILQIPAPNFISALATVMMLTHSMLHASSNLRCEYKIHIYLS
jgi:hypothetical protein